MAKSRMLVRTGLGLAAAILFGCIMGGQLDTPPARYAPQDTALVFVPPIDTVRPGDSVPVDGPRKMLYPRLNPGDIWMFSQKGDGYQGATAAMEIVGDSIYGGDSVYVQTISVRVPIFFSPYGDTVLNYVQNARLYMRMRDQETVHDTFTTQADVHYFGETVSSAYRMDGGSVTVFSGEVPDSLKAGVAWTIRAKRHSTAAWGWDGLPYGTRDSTWTDTVDYTVEASPLLKVEAGTFAVLRIDWATRGSESRSVGWYSRAAKSMIREIDGTAASADTSELAAFTLK